MSYLPLQQKSWRLQGLWKGIAEVILRVLSTVSKLMFFIIQIHHSFILRFFKSLIFQKAIFYNLMEAQKRLATKITCLRSINRCELFKQALGELFSQRYLNQQEKHFDSHLFIFEITTQDRTWSLFKEGRQLDAFFDAEEFKKKMSKQTIESITNVREHELERQGKIYEETLAEICTIFPQSLALDFFSEQTAGVHSFMMRKLSGGRYRESMCCKFGAIFQGWKERKVKIYLRGVGYYNESNELREFLSYSQGFYFQYGRPKTGKEFGIVLYANHRKLSLQAKDIRDFIFFLFILRKTCEESCYMTLNRFNSFAPIRNGNSVKFLVDGEEYFQAVYKAVERANVNVLITGWMLSPQFLLLRGNNNQESLEGLLLKAANKGVRISVILYHQSCFLPNDSLYFKDKLMSKSQNIKVLRHPSGKLPVLWSHHSKIVIIDEKEAFLGGFDMCYGRYDDKHHELFGNDAKYPGIEYNNIRSNDQLQVRNPKFPSIMRNQPRLPWHDVGIHAKGKVATDLVHHFYQMWHFIRYENKVKEEEDYSPSLFEVDVKSVFSTKVIPQEEPKTLFKSIENGLTTFKKTLKKKGKEVMKKVKKEMDKFGKEEKEDSQIKIRMSVNQDYFQKYFEEVNQEIVKKRENEQKILKKQTGKSKRRGSGISKRFSVQQVKEIKQCIQSQSSNKQQKLRKTNSFLLSGDRIIDYMNLDIGKDYIQCLEKVNQKRQKNSSILIPQDAQINSDQQQDLNSQVYEGNYNCTGLQQGHDQCQIVRSVGNWSIGCHQSNTEFSIHISYLQLISQAKSYIYIENQFFISSTADPNTVKNEVAYAIYLRIVKAIELGEEFRVYVMLPLVPGFAGDLENEECLLLRREMQWQYDTICRGQTSLWHRLLNHTNDPGKYIQFFGLRNHGRFDAMSQPVTEIIYLHSKLMIVDDEMVLCGSANINDRSLAGDRDSEIAMVVRGEDFVEGVINGESALVSQLAHQLRLKLWKEHFSFQEEEILDPVSTETWQKLANRAQQNTLIYRQLFGCYPDDLMTTRKKITEIKQASNPSLYNSLKDSILGHAVQFPLDFLHEQPLSCFITEKEFYMPAQCLT